MGAGKSTLARRMAKDMNALLLSEDEWLAALFPGEIHGLADYIKYSRRLKPVLGAHVRDILKSGLPVVMDFPANTVTQRNWFREIFEPDGMDHLLIYLDVDDATCIRQVAARASADPARARFDTEAMFRQVTGHFQPPTEQEGFNIRVVASAGSGG
ncbi:MAG: ATP-binding protein [Burkholderiales bacterium]|nr:ATP-binding protein [Burkholderiales bacterium]